MPRPAAPDPSVRSSFPRSLRVLVALLSAAAAFAFLTTFGQMVGLEKGRRTRARADLSNLSAGIQMFRIDTRRWPATLEELAAPPAGGDSRWDGPYVKDGAYLDDPWGRSYRYRVDSVGFVLLTLGADGLPGGVGEDADLRLTGPLELSDGW